MFLFVAPTGLLVLSSESHAADSFEAKSLATQRQRNVRVTSFSRDEVAAQHPRWAKGKFEAYLNHMGGWAESEQCVLECASRAVKPLAPHGFICLIFIFKRM